MKRFKVSELIGKELDYAVCFALERKNIGYIPSNFHENWNLVGELIEKNDIHLESNLESGNEKKWRAMMPDLINSNYWFRFSARTPLEAVCRVFVYSKLGQFVEVPEWHLT